MRFLTHQKNRYLLLIPIVFLIINAFYFMYATRDIQNTLLSEKYVEVIDMTEMLAAALEANENRLWFDHERNVRASVEYMDNIYQFYGSAYKLVGNRLVRITSRVYETSAFDPLAYPEFLDAVSAQETGELRLGHTPANQEYREMHLYFRWMPLYSPLEDRYLVVAGVSEHSIITRISIWVSAGQWASMLITFFLNAWLIVLLVNRGDDAKRFGGNKADNGGENSA